MSVQFAAISSCGTTLQEYVFVAHLQHKKTRSGAAKALIISFVLLCIHLSRRCSDPYT